MSIRTAVRTAFDFGMLSVCCTYCFIDVQLALLLYDRAHTLHTALPHATKFRSLLTGKALNSIGILNGQKTTDFKRRWLAGSNKTREEFMRSPKFSSREKRGLERGWNRTEGKLRRDFDRRSAYLGNRIYELTTRIATDEEHIVRLDDALSSPKLGSLFAPRPPPLSRTTTTTRARVRNRYLLHRQTGCCIKGTRCYQC